MKRSTFLKSIAVSLLAIPVIAESAKPKTRKGLIPQIQENESTLSEKRFDYGFYKNLSARVPHTSALKLMRNVKRYHNG